MDLASEIMMTPVQAAYEELKELQQDHRRGRDRLSSSYEELRKAERAHTAYQSKLKNLFGQRNIRLFAHLLSDQQKTTLKKAQRHEDTCREAHKMVREDIKLTKEAYLKAIRSYLEILPQQTVAMERGAIQSAIGKVVAAIESLKDKLEDHGETAHFRMLLKVSDQYDLFIDEDKANRSKEWIGADLDRFAEKLNGYAQDGGYYA